MTAIDGPGFICPHQCIRQTDFKVDPTSKTLCLYIACIGQRRHACPKSVPASLSLHGAMSLEQCRITDRWPVQNTGTCCCMCSVTVNVPPKMWQQCIIIARAPNSICSSLTVDCCLSAGAAGRKRGPARRASCADLGSAGKGSGAATRAAHGSSSTGGAHSACYPSGAPAATHTPPPGPAVICTV